MTKRQENSIVGREPNTNSVEKMETLLYNIKTTKQI